MNLEVALHLVQSFAIVPLATHILFATLPIPYASDSVWMAAYQGAVKSPIYCKNLVDRYPSLLGNIVSPPV